MLPGDGYKLISTTDISKHETADGAISAQMAYETIHPDLIGETLIKKPSISCNPGQNYPTQYL
jgi:hypothetical protein